MDGVNQTTQTTPAPDMLTPNVAPVAADQAAVQPFDLKADVQVGAPEIESSSAAIQRLGSSVSPETNAQQQWANQYFGAVNSEMTQTAADPGLDGLKAAADKFDMLSTGAVDTSQYFSNDPVTQGGLVQAGQQQLAGDISTHAYSPREPVGPGLEQSQNQVRAGVSQPLNPKTPFAGYVNPMNVPRAQKIQYLAQHQVGGNIHGLQEPVINAAHSLIQFARNEGFDVKIESGKREGSGGSYHNSGNAIDFNFTKNGKDIAYDGKNLALIRKWAKASGWASIIDEANHPIAGKTTGEHIHFAIKEDGIGLPGAYQLKDKGVGKEFVTDAVSPAAHADVAKKMGKYAFSAIAGKLTDRDQMTDIQVARHQAAVRGLDPDLFEAQIQAESGFNRNARSAVGAAGLAQIMPETGRWLAGKYGYKYEDVMNHPLTNLKVGAHYMSDIAAMPNVQGSYARMLAAYNMGPGNLDAFMGGKMKMPSETRNYVYKILKSKMPDLNINQIDQLVASGGGPKFDPKTAMEMDHTEASQKLSKPMKFLDALTGGNAQLIKDTMYGNVTQGKGAQPGDNAAVGALKNMWDAETGVIPDMTDVMARALNGVTLGLVPARGEHEQKRNAQMKAIVDEHPWLFGGTHTAVKGLSQLAGGFAMFEALLGESALAGAGRLIKGVAPEIEGAATGFRGLVSRSVQSLSRMAGGSGAAPAANGLLMRTIPLMATMMTENVGRHMFEYMHGAQAGVDKRGVGEAARDAFFHGITESAKGAALFGWLMPMAGELAMSSVARIPEIGEGLSEALTARTRNTVGNVLARGGGGAVLGYGGAQIANTFTQAAGLKSLYIDPAFAAGAGGLAGAGTQIWGMKAAKMIQGALDNSAASNPSNPIVQTLKTNFNKMWDGLDSAYQNSLTGQAMQHVKQYEENQVRQARIVAKDRTATSFEEQANAIEPDIQKMERIGQQHQTEVQSLQQQSQGMKQAVAKMEQDRPDVAQLFQNLQDNRQKLSSLEQQMEQTKQAEGAALQTNNKMAASAAAKQKSLLQTQMDQLQRRIDVDIQRRPEVLPYEALQKRVAQADTALAAKTQEFATFQEGVLKPIQWQRQVVDNFRSAAKNLREVPEEVLMDDQAFDHYLGNQDLVRMKVNPGDFSFLEGVNAGEVADAVSNTVIRDGFDEMIRRGVKTGGTIDPSLDIAAQQILGAKTNQSHDFALSDLQMRANKVASMPANKIYETFYGSPPMVSVTSSRFPSAMADTVVQWEGGGHALRADLLLDMAKRKGIDKNDPRIQAEAAEIEDRMTSGQKVKPGAFIENKANKFQSKAGGVAENDLLPDNTMVAHALAAQRMGESYVLFNQEKIDSGHLRRFVDNEKSQSVEEIREANRAAGRDVRAYSQNLREMKVSEALTGAERASDKVMNVSDLIDPNRTAERNRERFEALLSRKQPDLSPLEIMNEVVKGAEKNPEFRKALTQATVEELNILTQLSRKVAGDTRDPQVQKLDPKDPVGQTQEGVAIGKAADGTGVFVMDSKGNAYMRPRKIVVDPNVRAMMSEAIPQSSSHEGLMTAVKRLAGDDGLSLLNAEGIDGAALESQIDRMVKEGQGPTEGHTQGFTAQMSGRLLVSRRQAMRMVGRDVHDNLNAALQTRYTTVKAKNPNIRMSFPEFRQELVDSVEDIGEMRKFINKYGDDAKEALADMNVVTNAMNPFRNSSGFAKLFSRNSYFMHTYPTLAASASTQKTAGGEKVYFHDAVETMARQFPTQRAVRIAGDRLTKEIRNQDITIKDFLHSSPEQRLAKMEPDVILENLTEKERKDKLASYAQKGNLLLMYEDVKIKPDGSGPSVGSVMEARLNAIAHASGLQDLANILKRTPADVADPLNTGLKRTLLEIRHGSDASFTETGNGGYKRLSSSPVFGDRINLLGKEYDTNNILVHPEAMRFFEDYASTPAYGSMQGFSDTVKKINQGVSQLSLLGGFQAFMTQVSSSIMGEIPGFMAETAWKAAKGDVDGAVEAFDKIGDYWNLSGAGRKIRKSANGRTLEMLATRNGLNTRQFYESTFDILQGIRNIMPEQMALDIGGISKNGFNNFYDAISPAAPKEVRDRAYQELSGMGKRAVDFMGAPFEVEGAINNALQFQHIKDAQIAAFFTHAGRFGREYAAELGKIADPIERHAAMLQMASEVANFQTGAIPMHLIHKGLREAGAHTFTVQGWTYSTANAIVDALTLPIGLASKGVGVFSPAAAERMLDFTDRMTEGIGMRYKNLAPEVANAVRGRMARSVGAQLVSLAAATEVFNMLVNNGQTSYSMDPTGKDWGKMRIGNVILSTPLMGMVRRLGRMLHQGAGIAMGKNHEGYMDVVTSEIGSLFSPFAKGAAGAVGLFKSDKQKEQEWAEAGGDKFKWGLNALARTTGVDQFSGFRRGTSVGTMAAGIVPGAASLTGKQDEVDASRVSPLDFTLNQFGISRNEKGGDFAIRNPVEAARKSMEYNARQNIEVYLKAAHDDTTSPEKRQYYFEKAEQVWKAGVPVTNPELKKQYRERFHLKRTDFIQMLNRVRNPKKGAMSGMDRAGRQIMTNAESAYPAESNPLNPLVEPTDTETTPMAALTPAEPLDEDESE